MAIRIRVKRPIWDTIVPTMYTWLGSVISMAGTEMYCIPNTNQPLSFLDAMGALKNGDSNDPSDNILVASLRIVGKNVLPAAYTVNTNEGFRPDLANTAVCYLCCTFNGIPVAVPLSIPTCP